MSASGRGGWRNATTGSRPVPRAHHVRDPGVWSRRGLDASGPERMCGSESSLQSGDFGATRLPPPVPGWVIDSVGTGVATAALGDQVALHSINSSGRLSQRKRDRRTPVHRRSGAKSSRPVGPLRLSRPVHPHIRPPTRTEVRRFGGARRALGRRCRVGGGVLPGGATKGPCACEQVASPSKRGAPALLAQLYRRRRHSRGARTDNAGLIRSTSCSDPASALRSEYCP